MSEQESQLETQRSEQQQEAHLKKEMMKLLKQMNTNIVRHLPVMVIVTPLWRYESTMICFIMNLPSVIALIDATSAAVAGGECPD